MPTADGGWMRKNIVGSPSPCVSLHSTWGRGNSKPYHRSLGLSAKPIVESHCHKMLPCNSSLSFRHLSDYNHIWYPNTLALLKIVKHIAALTTPIQTVPLETALWLEWDHPGGRSLFTACMALWFGLWDWRHFRQVNLYTKQQLLSLQKAFGLGSADSHPSDHWFFLIKQHHMFTFTSYFFLWKSKLFWTCSWFISLLGYPLSELGTQLLFPYFNFSMLLLIFHIFP